MKTIFTKLRTHLRESCRAQVETAYEAVHDSTSAQRPSRLQMLLFLFHGIREQLRARRQAVPPAMAPPGVESPRAPCRNDVIAKAAEVRNTMVMCSAEGTALRAQLEELHRRGAFRHDYDVAYAVILLGRGGRALDELDQSYARSGHRCDPVYSPS